MRNRLLMVTAALVLASTSLALAQTQPAQPAPASPLLGSVSIGYQGSSVTGDEARFERYRDLRNRQNVQFDFAKATEKYLLDITAINVGNRNSAYGFDFANSKLKFEFSFDAIPFNYGYNTRTPWTVSTNGSVANLTLDPATRLAIETRTIPSGTVGIANNAATAALPSVWRPLATPFDLDSRRDSFHVGLKYAITRELEAEFALASHKRHGYMPFGGAFAFNNANEFPLPIDDRTTDIEAGVDWANDKGMFRIAYERSMFANTYNSLVWDNPTRATDYSGNRTTVTGYDPSGYSNGNGPATGRLATAPDNTLNAVIFTGLAKFARRTSLSGTLAVISMTQNDTLIPWTTNSVIANPAVYAQFPALAQLPRSTADAEVKALNASFVFNTRANQYVNLTARYRYHDHDNRTPAFPLNNTVRFDAVPEPPSGSTEPYTITQNKFDVDASFNVLPYTSFKIGYGLDANKKTYLAYRKLTDNTVRASVDTLGNQYVTFRAIFEHTKRSGSEFHQEAIVDPGGQPNLRLFDDAERTRDRATLLVTLMPMPLFDITASYGYGKDDYDIGLNPQFGLLNNDNNVVNVGFNVSPTDQVSFGLNVGQEKFTSLQRSRNANPGPDPSWTDPSRDWLLDNDETVRTFDLYLDVVRLAGTTDLRVAYDFSDSDNAFVHSGPRIDALRAISQSEALPNVTNKWHRFIADLKYFFTARAGVGLGYWYEKFEVSDFATIDLPGQSGDPRVDYLGGITTGYGNRPYTGSTGFIRLLYLF